MKEILCPVYVPEAVNEESKGISVLLATITVVVAVLVPLELVAVRVYSVVEVGLTISDPIRVDVVNAPGVIATDEAFATSQESVEVAPQ